MKILGIEITRKKRTRIRPPDYYFELAKEQCIYSNCQEVYWGAVLVSLDGEVIGKGFNYVPSDALMRYCNPCIRTKIRSCTQSEKCAATHAEDNAIADALGGHNIDKISNSDMYIFGFRDSPNVPIVLRYYPCMPCARKLIQYRIRNLWLYQPTAKNFKERKWLPFDEERMWAKFLPHFITGDQLWWHPGHWLGLEGSEIKDVDVKSKEKIE